jgi:hypothetical protein
MNSKFKELLMKVIMVYFKACPRYVWKPHKSVQLLSESINECAALYVVVVMTKTRL